MLHLHLAALRGRDTRWPLSLTRQFPETLGNPTNSALHLLLLHGTLHKQRHGVGLEGAEGPRDLGNNHVLDFKLNPLGLEEEIVDHRRVLVLHLIVVQLRHVFLGEGMNQQRRHKGEEAEEGSGPDHNCGVGGGVGPEDGLHRHPDEAGGQGERLDQLDLGGQYPVIDLLL